MSSGRARRSAPARLVAAPLALLLVLAACSDADDAAPIPTVAGADGGTSGGGSSDGGSSDGGSGDGGDTTAAGTAEAGSGDSDAGPVVVRRAAAPAPSGTFADGVFTETFDGKPTAPQPWAPGNWDVSVHSRNPSYFDSLEPMQAQHGPDCAGPPAEHRMDGYDNAVFLCRDHMMTAIQDEWYGMIYVTPDHMVDFATGEAVISFRMSTARTSKRDWPDVWITPFADNLQLPLEDFYPDVSGPPRNAVHVVLARQDDSDTFKGEVIRDFEVEVLPETRKTYADIAGFTPDFARRELFELRVSRTRVRFGMPEHDLWFVDSTIEDLGWSRGVVQFGHHSYNPNKECIDDSGDCGGGTWHWDEVRIAPAVPFTIAPVDARLATPGSPTLQLFQPAPAGAFLRFAAIGEQVELSTDGGATWTPAVEQAHRKPTAEEHFTQYFTPIPAGTTSVTLRAERWWGGDWRARDITVWSETRAA